MKLPTIRVDRHKVHSWTHRIHHFAEVILAGAIVYGSHVIEVWAIGCTGAAALALICLDCLKVETD